MISKLRRLMCQHGWDNEADINLALIVIKARVDNNFPDEKLEDISIRTDEKGNKSLHTHFIREGKISEETVPFAWDINKGWVDVEERLPDLLVGVMKKYLVRVKVGSMSQKIEERVLLGHQRPSGFSFNAGDWVQPLMWK